MEKIGILGGTFNPIHFGHLRTALEVRERFSLDRVLFVPAYIPPHKTKEDIVAPEARVEMTKKGIEATDFFEVDDTEIMRADVSYSIKTVKDLSEKYKESSLFFILGTDAFNEISTWNNYEEFIFLCDFIVMTRPGAPILDLKDIFSETILKRFKYDEKRELYENDKGNYIHFHEVTQLNISSTVIRNLIKEKKSIKYLVPESVERFILENGLYS